MWFILFWFLFAVCSGQTQQELCGVSPRYRCKQPLTSVNFFPKNEEQFEPGCSAVKRYLQCLRTGEVVCDEEIYKSYNQYERTVKLIDDICDNSTLLHYAYLESSPCFEYLWDNFTNVCINSKPDLFWDYQEFIRNHILYSLVGDVKRLSKTSGTVHLDLWKLLCLNPVYFISCVADVSSLQCSSIARNVTVEIAREIFYAHSICASRAWQELSPIIPNLDLDESLKSSLLSTLEGLYHRN